MSCPYQTPDKKCGKTSKDRPGGQIGCPNLDVDCPRILELEEQRDRANELLKSCRAQLKRTQDERDSMWEVLVRIHTVHGLMEDQVEAVWARNIEDLREAFGVEKP